MTTIALSERSVAGAVAAAMAVIGSGGIIAFPTETFYGLGARYDDERALKRLYEAKQRPGEKAMPLIIGKKEMISIVAAGSSMLAERLMQKFWPGPLTLLLPALDSLSGHITAQTGKVAVRMPGESFALHLARALPYPITATSANLSGMPAAVSAEDVRRYFGRGLDLLVDGGRTPGGRPSTILDVSGAVPEIVREGIIAASEIMDFLGENSDQ